MAKKKQDKRLFEDDDILVRNNDQFLFTEVDGESVVMNVDSGHYFGMNSVSTDIWHMLDIDLSFNEMIKSILKTYDVDEDTCRKDTRPAIAKMILGKLLLKKETV